ncbi:MAG: Asp-tRNA(Asn)/Glu-tRNA(Gln) amidotransferase subunit GatC [Oscillospiraceae bacterium]|jgi:aspartyl-tRNA(Asn)/glutamyl-tRNA(Gln) amidotransferase subunit C
MEIDIKHIAKLSRLKVDDNDVQKFEKEMQAIIQMVEKLPDMPTDVVLIDPEHPMKLREDVVNHEYRRDDILKNAPQVQAGCVVVPKVVE